jgi:SAM-dependent methyltransferase
VRDNKADATRLREEVQAAVDRILAGKTDIRGLEAGCGSMSHLRLPESAHLTGLDVSPSQLDRNERIHERIVGDLQTIDLPPESFDVVVCWNVLEHLRDPEAAVTRLAVTVKPGGALVIACPNPLALRSMVARLTPLWFHVWFYEKMLGLKGAGADDVGPFPTYMSRRIAPKALCESAESCGLEVELQRLAKVNLWWAKRSVVRRAIDAGLDGLAFAFRVLSFGRYRGELAQTRLVFKKTGRAT